MQHKRATFVLNTTVKIKSLSLFLSLQVDAIEYYRTKEKNLLEEMRTQVETVPEHPLGIAFVTLQNVAMAKL